jgi:hypothetical protein
MHGVSEIKNLNKKRSNLWWIFASIFAMSLGGVFSFFIFYFEIKNINFMNNKDSVNIRHAKISRVLEYAKSYNLLIFSTDFLKKSLLLRFPELKDVEIKKEYPNTLYVKTTPDTVIIKWVYKIINNEQSYMGYLNSKSLFLEHGSNIVTTIYDIQPREKKINYYSILEDGDHISNILEAKSFLENIIQRKVVKINYLKDAQEVHFVDEKKVEYWCYLPIDLIVQINKLSKMLSVKNIIKKKVEYIDLRINNKVIYK